MLPTEPAQGLASLRRLHTLEVDHNALDALPAAALPGGLRSLSAQHNALLRFPAALLDGQPRLQRLLLRGNLIRTLPRAGLRAPRALDRLDLAENDIQVGTHANDQGARAPSSWERSGRVASAASAEA